MIPLVHGEGGERVESSPANWDSALTSSNLAPAAALDGMAGAAVLDTGAEASCSQGAHAASASPNPYPKGQT